MTDQKKPEPQKPAPGTTDFRETTKLERGDDPPKSPADTMKQDRGFRETHSIVSDD